jgi:Uma2 family endonuclease
MTPPGTRPLEFTAFSQPEQGHWTYSDWLGLPDDGFSYEVLNGILHISPPPSTHHQRVSLRLAARMLLHAEKNDLGEVLEAPVGVRLPTQPVPLQPDLLFILKERKSIIGKEYVEGAPDLIVEILSPSNWPLDRREKFQAYRDAGVSEYWIVDPRARLIEVFTLEDSGYALLSQCRTGDTARSAVLRGFEIAVNDLLG